MHARAGRRNAEDHTRDHQERSLSDDQPEDLGSSCANSNPYSDLLPSLTDDERKCPVEALATNRRLADCKDTANPTDSRHFAIGGGPQGGGSE
jgi:hypothetical protein